MAKIKGKGLKKGKRYKVNRLKGKRVEGKVKGRWEGKEGEGEGIK